MNPEAQSLVQSLLSGEHLFTIVAGVTFILWIVLATVASITRSITAERTRREIAAYIAEGSMTPEQGERLMAAGRQKHGGCC